MSTLLQKLKTSMPARLVAYIIGGIAISGIIFFVLIYFGYASVLNTQASSYLVTCLGLPIYEITSSADGPVGRSVGVNMPIIGMVCSLGIALVVELVLALRAKNKK